METIDRKPDPRRLNGDRRRFMACFAAAGLGSSLLPGVLWAKWQESESPRITAAMLKEAEHLTGVEFTPEERELMLEDVNERLQSYRRIRELDIPNSVVPAWSFDPRLPGQRLPRGRKAIRPSQGSAREIPQDREELAFWPLTELSRLIRDRRLRAQELTELYLDRLKRFDPQLKCVVTLTEDLALAQARRADREIRSGGYRGPLHGIPWGAKDLLSTRRYPTTWGAMPYREQVIDEDAAVVSRLAQAGAVLVAKLTLGALAWGDVWFRGQTKNPWNLQQGSSGSSAGPGSATAAGLVGFSIGSETWGSIISPSTRCGVTGLRPTFGRVSRHGAMALSWTMDKLGPMCRSVEDCALVFDAIHGADPRDPTSVEYPFNWDAYADPKRLKIGYLAQEFEREPNDDADRSRLANDRATLQLLKSMGFELHPMELPEFPVESLSFILEAEAAAAFEELSRSNRDDELVRQVRMAWPNVFRHSRLIPAVEYIQANRARSILMAQMHESMRRFDLYIAPSFSSSLLLTNLTGHPAVCIPNGFDQQGSPTSITFTGHLYREAEMLSLAKACQDASPHRLRHPELA